MRLIMDYKPHNKKLLITVLILLIFCAVYLAYDVAAGDTPVWSFFVPTGAILLFCIYMLLKQLFFK